MSLRINFSAKSQGSSSTRPFSLFYLRTILWSCPMACQMLSLHLCVYVVCALWVHCCFSWKDDAVQEIASICLALFSGSLYLRAKDCSRHTHTSKKNNIKFIHTHQDQQSELGRGAAGQGCAVIGSIRQHRRPKPVFFYIGCLHTTLHTCEAVCRQADIKCYKCMYAHTSMQHNHQGEEIIREK